jgi:hypothetical protein
MSEKWKFIESNNALLTLPDFIALAEDELGLLNIGEF